MYKHTYVNITTHLHIHMHTPMGTTTHTYIFKHKNTSLSFLFFNYFFLIATTREFQDAADKNAYINPPINKTLEKSILVPFPPEACLSGIGASVTSDAMWYVWMDG